MQNNLKKLLLLPSILFAQVYLFANGMEGGFANPNNEVYSQTLTQETSLVEPQHITKVVSYTHILSVLMVISVSVLLLHSYCTSHQQFHTTDRYLLQNKIMESVKKQMILFLNFNFKALYHNAFYSVHYASSSRIS